MYFASHTRAKIRKLKLQLKAPKKDRSNTMYLLDIKKTVDSLAAVGVPFSSDEYIEVILDDLSDDYVFWKHVSKLL